MKAIKTVKTNISEASLLENDLLYIKYTIPKYDSIELLKEQIELIQEAFGDKSYVLVNTSKIKQMSREVRNFLATPEALNTAKVIAVVVGKGLSHIVGNLYLKFNQPSIPTKLFNSFEKAEAWLLKEKARIENTK